MTQYIHLITWVTYIKYFVLLGAMLCVLYHMLSLENSTEETEAKRRLLICPTSNSWLIEI